MLADWYQLSTANVELLAGALVFIAGAAIPIAIVWGIQYRKLRQTQDDNDLKLEMLDRGHSAEEIERVLNSGRRRPPVAGAKTSSPRHRNCRSAQPV
jgi:hypothetical protein